MKPVYLRSSKLPSLIALLALHLGGSGCVTVHVNFPESAVQKASDDFVKDLYRAKEKPKSSAPTSDVGKPKPPTKPKFSFFIPTAVADEVEFTVDTPNSSAIKARMSERVNGSLLDLKSKGLIGERADGLVEARGDAPPLLKKRVDAIVAEENKDRKQLYNELKSANPKATIEQIQRSFSKSFQSESPSGTEVESTPGTWSKKR